MSWGVQNLCKLLSRMGKLLLSFLYPGAHAKRGLWVFYVIAVPGREVLGRSLLLCEILVFWVFLGTGASMRASAVHGWMLRGYGGPPEEPQSGAFLTAPCPQGLRS